MHHGHPSAKPTKCWSNMPQISLLDLGRLPKEEREAKTFLQTTRTLFWLMPSFVQSFQGKWKVSIIYSQSLISGKYVDSNGKERFCGTSGLSQSKTLGESGHPVFNLSKHLPELYIVNNFVRSEVWWSYQVLFTLGTFFVTTKQILKKKTTCSGRTRMPLPRTSKIVTSSTWSGKGEQTCGSDRKYYQIGQNLPNSKALKWGIFGKTVTSYPPWTIWWNQRGSGAVLGEHWMAGVFVFNLEVF